LSAGGIQCSSLNFFSLQNEVRQLQWVGIFHRIQDSRCSGLRTRGSGTSTQNGDTNHMAAGGKTNAVAGFACNLHPSLSFKHSPPPNHPTTFHFAIAGKTMNFLSQQRRRARNPELIHIPVATIMTSSSRQWQTTVSRALLSLSLPP